MYTPAERVFGWTVFVVGCILAVFGFVVLGKALAADGAADYCFIRGIDKSRAALYAHRPWREDRFIGYYDDATDATVAATSIGCKVR